MTATLKGVALEAIYSSIKSGNHAIIWKSAKTAKIINLGFYSYFSSPLSI